MTAGTWIAARRSLWERRLARLGDYLARAAPGRQRPRHQPDNSTQPDHLEEEQ
jgi:hypothetical protein